jgi:hypothetical protein
MRRLVVAAIALALAGLSALAAGTAPQTKTPRRLFEDTGPITRAEVEKDGALVFRLFEQRILYRIPGQPKPKMERLTTIFRDAGDQGRSVTVGFDAAEGSIDPATATIRYPVCSLAVGDQREEPVPRCAPDGPVTATGEQALALAYGFQAVRDFAAAAPLLEGAGDLPAAVDRRLGLWLRARTHRPRPTSNRL